MMQVVKEAHGYGYRLEMPNGHYEYITNEEALRLFDNLRDALRPGDTRPAPTSTDVADSWLRSCRGQVAL